MSRRLEPDDLTAIEAAIDEGDDLDLSDIRDLVAEVRSLRAELEEFHHWNDGPICEACDMPRECPECGPLFVLAEQRAEKAEARVALADADRERGSALEVALDRERTGRLQAEARVAELEALLAQTDFILSVLNGDCDPGDYCPEAEIVAADAYARHRARQAHAALAAREPVEGRDFERMPGVPNA